MAFVVSGSQTSIPCQYLQLFFIFIQSLLCSVTEAVESDGGPS